MAQNLLSWLFKMTTKYRDQNDNFSFIKIYTSFSTKQKKKKTLYLCEKIKFYFLFHNFSILYTFIGTSQVANVGTPNTELYQNLWVWKWIVIRAQVSSQFIPKYLLFNLTRNFFHHLYFGLFLFHFAFSFQVKHLGLCSTFSS